MHIAFITPEYPHQELKLKVGGIASFTKNLATSLIDKGFNVTVFLISQNENRIINDNGISIHLIKRKKVKGFTWYFNRKNIEHYINNIININNINIIEAPEWTGITALMRFNIPLVLRLHGSDTYFCKLEKRKVKYKNKFFEKRALERADRIIGVSKFVSNETKKIFNLKKNIKIIYNAIDVKKFLPEHMLEEEKTILYFGTIVRKKGVLELSSIFNIVVKREPNAKLILIGNDTIYVFEKKSTLGILKNDLSQIAASNLKYYPAVPYKDIRGLILKANVVVLPSYAEAFPMTWLEAMALEKKMVTSNIGWANELMEDGVTGYLVNPKNHNLFAKRIIDFFKGKKNKDFPKNARKRIKEKFNQDIIIEENIKFYKDLVI